MKNFYSALGLNNSATAEEIRRAYRTLARRYHPDVNPGQESSDKFKLISEAYRTLQDPARRKDYDLKLELHERIKAEEKLRTYASKFRKREQLRPRPAKERFTTQPQPDKVAKARKEKQESTVGTLLKSFQEKLFAPFKNKKDRDANNSKGGQVSIIEISLTLEDSIHGIKKTIEVQEPAGIRKISVRIPPGVRTGSVIRMRNRFQLREELVLIISIAQHPYMRLEKKGLIVELPITFYEAIHGSNVTVPTLSDQLVIKIPAGSQSGTHIRLKGRGIKDKDGIAGDLFFLLMIHIPEEGDSPALLQLSRHLQDYYSKSVRSKLPKRLLEPTADTRS